MQHHMVLRTGGGRGQKGQLLAIYLCKETSKNPELIFLLFLCGSSFFVILGCLASCLSLVSCLGSMCSQLARESRRSRYFTSHDGHGEVRADSSRQKFETENIESRGRFANVRLA